MSTLIGGISNDDSLLLSYTSLMHFDGFLISFYELIPVKDCNIDDVDNDDGSDELNKFGEFKY